MATRPPPYTALPTGAPPAYTIGDSYAPLQPVIHHSSTSTVVVAHAPAPTTHICVMEPRAADNFILTIIMMILCGSLLNVFAFACLIPAIFFSVMASNANERGDYIDARRKGQLSLWLNLTAIISYIALMIIGILLGVIVAISSP